MKIDLTCPVEAWKVTLPTPEESACTVKMFNLSALPVVSVEVTLTLSSLDGEESAKVTHRGRGLEGVPGKVFYMTVPVEGRIRAETYEVAIEKVWFDNSSVWRREKENTIEFEPNNLHRSAQLTNLRAVAGDMASGYPVQQEGLWLCVCGRPNPDDQVICARCHREKNDVFARFNQGAINAAVAAIEADLAARGKEVLSRSNSEPDERGRDHVHRKKKHGGAVVKSIAALAAAGVLAWGGYFHAWPHVRYQLAKVDREKALTADALLASEDVFLALGDYRDAPELAERSRFARALSILNMSDDDESIPAGTEESSLLEARELLLSLQPSDLDATAELRDLLPAYIRLIDAARADLCLTEDRLDEADALYASLGDAAMQQEIVYRRAMDAFEAGEWAQARERFASLGDYKDAQECILDTLYYEGTMALDLGDAQKGLDILASLSGHRDADERILQYHYDLGAELLDEGRTDEAAEEFYLAIGYADAADQANECFYGPASVAYETMDYERAAQLFEKILDYRDAREKWTRSVLKAAEKAMKEIRYDKARTLLAQLPADNAEAASLLLDCTYEPARNAYIRGDYAEAVAGFQAVPGHRDADDMLAKARFALAEEKFAAGEYDAAAALYALLTGDQAAERLQAVKYAQAEMIADMGTEEALREAIASYEALGGYQDSPEKLLSARYDLAGAILSKGDHAGARAIYASLGDYADAAAQLLACDYALADELSRTDPAAALTAFTALGDYSDAADRVLSLRYDAASALAATDAEGAIAAFEALGDYADAADRASALRYDAAEALIDTDRTAAIASFEALGDYADAPDRALALRYAAAEALIDTDRTAAIASFKALGGYKDAADRVLSLRYEDALALIETDRAAALTALRSLGDYADAADRAAALRYEDAEALLADGDWQGAADILDTIPDHWDAATRADELRYDAAMKAADKGDWTGAQAAFAAMGNAEYATEQVNQLRYAAAEKLLTAGQKETAAAAFAAISGYSDAADRANALRYELAEALIATDVTAAAEAFASLGDYKDAADRALAVRLDAAEALAASGRWDEAIAAFEALDGYGSSAERILQIKYNQAAVLAASGEWDAAAEAFASLGDYADSADRVQQTRYDQAASIAKGGDVLAAADAYDALNGYKDASQQAAALREGYYGAIAATVATAREKGDYTHMYLLLRSEDLSKLPEKYAYLTDLWYEACYSEGNRYYEAERPYEAYACYAALPAGYKNLTAIMQRPCYMILGTWESLDGGHYLFDPNGICNLAGESYYFIVDGTDMHTGKDATLLTKTHSLSGVTKKNAWLTNVTTGEKVYLTKVK